MEYVRKAKFAAVSAIMLVGLASCRTHYDNGNPTEGYVPKSPDHAESQSNYYDANLVWPTTVATSSDYGNTARAPNTVVPESQAIVYPTTLS